MLRFGTYVPVQNASEGIRRLHPQWRSLLALLLNASACFDCRHGLAVVLLPNTRVYDFPWVHTCEECNREGFTNRHFDLRGTLVLCANSKCNLKSLLPIEWI